MKLQIGGTQHDWQDALFKANLFDLLDLSKAAGIGPKSILAGIAKFGEQGEAAQEDPDFIAAMLGLVFLCHRRSGDHVDFKTMNVSYADLEWVIEESDETPDPTQASGDQTPPGPETKNESPSSGSEPSKRSSKTSKSPSTPTS